MDIDTYISRAVGGDKRSLGKILSYIEDDPIKTSEILSKLLSKDGRSHVIGVTGIPGSGKSTLISKLINNYRGEGCRIAVIAIDPSSPYSRGALLGDRLRMQEHSIDPNVFIRSVSTRGLKGGISLAAIAMIEVFDAIGYDKIFIESVGVGQADVDIMNIAHTLLVVTMPGAGDEIQSLKAGIMEIGDIYVLNKSDKQESIKTYEFLEFALESGEFSYKGKWKPRIVKTSAIMGIGIDELMRLIDEHYKYLIDEHILRDKVDLRRRFMLKLLIEKLFTDRLEEVCLREAISLRPGTNIYNLAVKIINKVLDELQN